MCTLTLIHRFKPLPFEPHLVPRQAIAQWCCNRQDSPRVSAEAAHWIKARRTIEGPCEQQSPWRCDRHPSILMPSSRAYGSSSHGAIVLPASCGTRPTTASLAAACSSLGPCTQRPCYQQCGTCYTQHQIDRSSPTSARALHDSTHADIVHEASYYTRPTEASGSSAPPSPDPRGSKRPCCALRRHDRRRVESDDVVGAAAVLRRRESELRPL